MILDSILRFFDVWFSLHTVDVGATPLLFLLLFVCLSPCSTPHPQVAITPSLIPHLLTLYNFAHFEFAVLSCFVSLSSVPCVLFARSSLRKLVYCSLFTALRTSSIHSKLQTHTYTHNYTSTRSLRFVFSASLLLCFSSRLVSSLLSLVPSFRVLVCVL